jgi:glycosyltransferase involved in cell wall biosynthesis
MKIKILHQFHNNMFDTVKALETLGPVEFLSYRTSKLVAGISSRQPSLLPGVRQYNPWHLWQLLGTSTDVLIVKHINDPINFFPYLIARLKKIQCVIVIQRLTHPVFPGYHLLLRILLSILRSQKAVIMAVTPEGFAASQPLGLRSKYIPACINVERFSLPDKRVHSPKNLHILTVSKYQTRKNIPLLIQAVADLQRTYSAVTVDLTIVGALSNRQDSHTAYQAMHREIAEQELTNVHLHTNVPPPQMPQYYHRADLFVLPAHHEPLGYAVLEAMASGLPVLVSNDTGAAGYVKPARNGWVFDPHSRSSLLAAFSHFFTANNEVDVALIKQLGHNSRQLAHDHHEPEIFLQQFKSLVG